MDGFLDRYFSTSRMQQLIDEITYFCQLIGEPLYEMWQRFNEEIMQYPNHEVQEKILLQIFYRAVDQLNKTIIDNASRECLVKLSYRVASNFLNQVTKKNRGWHTQDSDVTIRSSVASYLNKGQRKKDQ